MDAKQFANAVTEAKQLVSSVDEIYRVAAFQVALSVLMDQSTQETKKGEQSSFSIDVSYSFEEFAAQLPKSMSHPDRFVLVAYYMTRFDQIKEFRANEIVDNYYIRVSWSRPQNASDVANQCAKKRGYFRLVRSDEKGMKLWNITPTGIAYAEKMLQPDEVEPA